MNIRERILARAELNAMRAARDTVGLAAALNADAPLAPHQRFITARGIMAGCAGGNAILDALDAAAAGNSAVRRAVKFLEQEAGLDVGDPYTQDMIDQLRDAAILTEAQAGALKALGLRPVIVTAQQVSDALYNDDGTEK